MNRLDTFLLGISVGALIFQILITLLSDAPLAIDVYRGKTTLEITYRDSVIIDSVVVWKKEQ